MSKIVVCLDCPMYQKGGYCRKRHKDVGAISEACDWAKNLDQLEDEDDAIAEVIDIVEDLTDTETPEVEPNTPTTKTCSDCGRELPLESFSRNVRALDGHQGKCKDCVKKALQKSQDARLAKRKTTELKKRQEAAANCTQTKTCNKCGRTLPVTEFDRAKDTKDGYDRRCKDCKAKTYRDRKTVASQTIPTELPKVITATSYDVSKTPDQVLVNELRSRGWTVKATRPITIIEEI